MSTHKKRKENYVGGETPPTSIKEKETHWLRRAVSLPTTRTEGKRNLMQIRWVPRGTRPWDLAVGSIIVCESTSSGHKFVGVNSRMGIQTTGKFSGTLVVTTQLFELIKGVLYVTSSTNAQENGVNGDSLSIYELTQARMLLLSRFQLMLRPGIFTILYLNQMYMSIVDIEKMWLLHAAGCVAPLYPLIPAAQHITWWRGRGRRMRRRIGFCSVRGNQDSIRTAGVDSRSM